MAAMAAETIKMIVKELNDPPYKKGYNLISFDQLDNNMLLQVLSDVIGAVEEKEPVDIRTEQPEQTFARFSQTLRILKFNPPGDPVEFRNGLVGGERAAIYPVLEWLFKNKEMHKKRAYLARYLLKIEVPAEVMDQELMDIYHQYEEIMESFKTIHKEHEHLKETESYAQEIRKDINKMEEEKETLSRRVEKQKKKVEGMASPKKEELYLHCKSLRQEKEHESELSRQKDEQINAMANMEEKHQRLADQMKRIKSSGQNLTPTGLLQRLEDENKANSYLATEKLPQELLDRKESLQNLTKIVTQPAMNQADLNDIQVKVRQVENEITEIKEKQLLHSDPDNEKLALFRQQSAMIARKLENVEERHKEVKAELETQEAELMSKRGGLGDDVVLKGEDFKHYVNQLRLKSNLYKKKRQEVQEVKAECGVLSRTEELLRTRDQQLTQQLRETESKQGANKYDQGPRDKGKIDKKGLQDMSALVKTLNGKMNEKKKVLAPLIKERQTLREKQRDMSRKWDDKKELYDNMAAGFEGHVSKLDQEVKQLQEDLSAEESRHFEFKCKIQLLEAKSEIVENKEAWKTYKEALERELQEAEGSTDKLREEMNSMKETMPDNSDQVKMWKDFAKIMDAKMRLKSQVYNVTQANHGVADCGQVDSTGADRLVL